MRYGCLIVALFLGIVLGNCPVANADDGGWSVWPSFESWKMPELSMPKLSKPAEPSFVRATRQGIGKAWQGTVRTSKSAWNSTVSAFRPYDSPETHKKSVADKRRDADAGFWSGLFGPRREPKPSTVNEFLRQPSPY